jgi:C4-dicarboxylate transporter, DctQ subunit
MLEKAFSRVVGGMAGVAAFLILFILVSICMEVILRYFFGRPLLWTVEASEYLQIYITFLAATWVLRQDGHVNLEILLDMVGKKTKRIFYYASNTLGFVTALAIAIFSGTVTYQQLVLGTPVIKALEVPKWMVLAPIPVGCFFLTLEFMWRIAKGYKEH